MSALDDLLDKGPADENEDDLPQGDLSAEVLARYEPEKLARIFLRRAGKGRRLELAQRQRFERILGEKGQGGHPAFGRVRIFTGELADDVTRAHKADALTLSNTGIVLMRSSKFDTHSLEGERVLAHELTHVAQAQKGMHARSSGGARIGGAASEREAYAAEGSVRGGGGGAAKKSDPREEQAFREMVFQRVAQLLDEAQITSWQRIGFAPRTYWGSWRPL
jgi:hypothetical protein